MRLGAGAGKRHKKYLKIREAEEEFLAEVVLYYDE